MGKAAIVILNFNGKDILSRFLPEVVKNSTFEIIIIDNASEDGSIDYINEAFPEIKVLALSHNFGYSKGYNEGLARLKDTFEFYLLLNSDVLVTHGWDESLIQFLESDPKAAAVQPKVLSLINKGFFDYAGAAGGYLDALGYPYCRGRILHEIEKDEGQYDQPVQVDWASGACFVVRAALFHQFGGFNPDFFAHMEEIDLCMRWRREGYKVYCSSNTIIYHLGGGTLSQSNSFKTYLNFRNSLFMIEGNLKTTGKLKVLVIRVFLDFAAAIHISFTRGYDHGLAILKAYWHYIKLKRKVTQYDSRSEKISSCDPKKIKSIIFSYYIKGKRQYSDLS